MSCRLHAALLSASLLALAAGFGMPACGTQDQDDAELRAQCEELSSDLYERRIAPLFSADRPQSCNSCHLSGVDLSLFVRDSACESIACLVELGLADPGDPDRSVVLEWIRRARPESELITEEVIEEEYDAFRSWLVESLACGDGACRKARCGPARREVFCHVSDPLEAESTASDLDCSDAELELLFRDRVFAQRGRCYPCHHEDQDAVPPEVPRFFATEGSCNAASLETFRRMRRAGYFDLEDTAQSLLLLKPLGPEGGGVEHGGDAKFHGTADVTYQSFLAYLERLAACQSP